MDGSNSWHREGRNAGARLGRKAPGCWAPGAEPEAVELQLSHQQQVKADGAGVVVLRQALQVPLAAAGPRLGGRSGSGGGGGSGGSGRRWEVHSLRCCRRR